MASTETFTLDLIYQAIKEKNADVVVFLCKKYKEVGGVFTPELVLKIINTETITNGSFLFCGPDPLANPDMLVSYGRHREVPLLHYVCGANAEQQTYPELIRMLLGCSKTTLDTEVDGVTARDILCSCIRSKQREIEELETILN